MKQKLSLLILIILLLIAIGLDLTQFNFNPQLLAILIPDFRLPRLLILLGAALALACSGLIFQTVSENPLADAGTMGLTSGASFGAVLFLLLTQLFKLPSSWNSAYPVFAAGGSLLAFGLIYLFALRQKVSNVRVLLTGIAITAFFQSLILILQLKINSFDFQQVAVWLSGDVWQTNPWFIAGCLILLLIALILLILELPRLEVLALGQDLASSMGLEVEAAKRRLYFLAVVFAVIGVLLVGGLAFVGLIAPHIARVLSGFKLRKRLLFSGLSAMLMLVLADLLAQLLIAPSSLPLGLVVAFIGAPYYIYLIQKI